MQKAAEVPDRQSIGEVTPVDLNLSISFMDAQQTLLHNRYRVSFNTALLIRRNDPFPTTLETSFVNQSGYQSPYRSPRRAHARLQHIMVGDRMSR
jgi:hypothetical protein